MRLQKQLNIDNTFRVLNLNFFNKNQRVIQVNTKNKEQVLASLKDDQEHYYVIDGTSDDLLLNRKVYQNQDHIIYYTTNMIPLDALLQIGSNRKAIFMYRLHNFSQQELKNMTTTSAVGTTALYVPNIKEYDRPTPIMFNAEDARFIADRLYLDFNSKVSLDTKEKYFDILHEALARWTIQLYLSYNDKKEYQILKRELIKKYK